MPKQKLFYLTCFLSMALSLTKAQAQDSPRSFLQTLEPYKPIYIVQSAFMNDEGSSQGFENNEVVIQFSFKKQIYNVVYFGYSHKAFWQVYDNRNSRPFRDQNYNPEVFLEYADIWGLDTIRLGLAEHESNGNRKHFNEAGEEINYSRTWDRSSIYIWKQATDYLGLGLKTWVVTSPRTEEYSSYFDDNPDMQEYMGSGELYARFGYFPMALTVMLRRGWKEETETIRLEARFPLHRLVGTINDKIDLFGLYFSGYGDSLMDYNRKVIRSAIGFSVR